MGCTAGPNEVGIPCICKDVCTQSPWGTGSASTPTNTDSSDDADPTDASDAPDPTGTGSSGGGYISLNGVTCQNDKCSCDGKQCPGTYDYTGYNCINAAGSGIPCICTNVCGSEGPYTSSGNVFGNGAGAGAGSGPNGAGSGSVTTPNPGSPTKACNAQIVQNGVTVVGCDSAGNPTTKKSTAGAAPTGQPREFAMAGLAGLLGVAIAM